MSREQQQRTMQQLLVAASAGEASSEQWIQLATILQQSEEARDHAVTLLDQISSLEWLTEESAGVIDGRKYVAAAHIAPSRRRHWFRPLAYGTAAAIVTFATFQLWRDHSYEPALTPVAVIDTVVSATNPAPPQTLSADRATGTSVAWLMDMTPDAKWASGASPDEFLLRLLPGKRLELLSGLARIKFASGAIIILEGPCVFIPTGNDSAALVRGRVTGRADKGNFHLTTPAARVVDLGTEFGVAVDGSLATDVIVFEGSVTVSPSDWAGEGEEPVQLDAGATARVKPNGDLATGIVVRGVEFYREFPGSATRPEIEIERLSLVDVICDGGLAAGIDPSTGERDTRPWQFPQGPGRLKSDGKYHRCSLHPMVDGVFIPSAAGKDVAITSGGDRVTLPVGGAQTWGPVWGRRRTDSNLKTANMDYWGSSTLPYLTHRLEASRDGLLGIHADVGITFDLQACDKRVAGRFRSLEGTFVKLDLAAERGLENLQRVPSRTVDFWVIVDGEVRFNKKSIGPGEEGLDFDVPLRSSDRFLTLITTDGGDGISFDNTFLVDPVLTIVQ